MRTAAIIGMSTVALLLAGCNAGARIAKANDQLRIEREAQTGELDSLRAENAELAAKVSELNGLLESPIPDDVLEALPRVAEISLSRFTTVADGEAVWYVTPADGRGRFVQVVGTLEVRAISTGESPDVIASITLSPTELRDAFVSGLTGSAYRVAVPLAGETAGSVTMTAMLHDHVTGATHEASRIAPAR